MTMAELKQYRKEFKALLCEAADYRQEISDTAAREIVTDVVSGSNLESPWTKRPVSISGIGIDAETKRIETKRQELITKRAAVIKQLDEIEHFIYGIDDGFVRWAVKLYVQEGLTWQKISNRYGNELSASAILMRVKRFLENL